MSTTPQPHAADAPDYFAARDERLGAARPTDCAVCRAPLPPGNRYLCAACVADSASQAQRILDALEQGPHQRASGAGPDEVAPGTADGDEYADCPACGMRLDASGRCAGCVTTVRR